MTDAARIETARPTEFDSLNAALKRAAGLVDRTLDEVLPRPEGLHARVPEAMRYAIFAGGKRLRPFLTIESAALFGVPQDRAARVAAAIEALHTYSLVHDDLPCMDDDDLRRGRPTAHRQFDEATAVLAGDALLTVAFGILADAKTHPSGEVRARLVAKLAEAGGSAGMIGGQMIDMLAPERDYGEAEVILLQALKTGALFEFACEAGAILAEASDDDQRRLRDFARGFGLAFQIADDIIDATGTAEQAGKAVGKDQDQGKATLISLYGLDKARSEAARLASEAAQALAPYGPAADDLRALPFFLLDRPS
ncbi:MAG: polyprenyl synthetase family protein [Caulobacteraceae bacterium]|nr:polyprenyl synthetase family protein [Caulobacteraceae bacterium]